jgi:hypothetical protein
MVAVGRARDEPFGGDPLRPIRRPNGLEKRVSAPAPSRRVPLYRRACLP